MANLVPYPTDMSEAADVLLSKVTGGDVPLATAIHAGYQLQGCLLSKLYPDGGSGGMKASKGDDCCPDECCACPCDDEQGKAALKCIADGKDSPAKAANRGAGMKGAPVDGPLANLILQQALAYAMQLLQQWLTPKKAMESGNEPRPGAECKK